MSDSETEGFSLVEMLVALAIIALATTAVLVTPFAAKREMSIELAAKQIASHLNGASAKAASDGRTVSIDFDVDRRAMLAANLTLVQLPADVRMTLRTGVELIKHESEGSIQFLADGSSSGGEVTLSASSKRKVRIRVNWATSTIDISAVD